MAFNKKDTQAFRVVSDSADQQLDTSEGRLESVRSRLGNFEGLIIKEVFALIGSNNAPLQKFITFAMSIARNNEQDESQTFGHFGLTSLAGVAYTFLIPFGKEIMEDNHVVSMLQKVLCHHFFEVASDQIVEDQVIKHFPADKQAEMTLKLEKFIGYFNEMAVKTIDTTFSTEANIDDESFYSNTLSNLKKGLQTHLKLNDEEVQDLTTNMLKDLLGERFYEIGRPDSELFNIVCANARFDENQEAQVAGFFQNPLPYLLTFNLVAIRNLVNEVKDVPGNISLKMNTIKNLRDRYVASDEIIRNGYSLADSVEEAIDLRAKSILTLVTVQSLLIPFSDEDIIDYATNIREAAYLHTALMGIGNDIGIRLLLNDTVFTEGIEHLSKYLNVDYSKHTPRDFFSILYKALQNAKKGKVLIDPKTEEYMLVFYTLMKDAHQTEPNLVFDLNGDTWESMHDNLSKINAYYQQYILPYYSNKMNVLPQKQKTAIERFTKFTLGLYDNGVDYDDRNPNLISEILLAIDSANENTSETHLVQRIATIRRIRRHLLNS